MSEVNAHVRIHRLTPRSSEVISSAVVGESRWTLFVNGQELVTFMATPHNLHHLAAGFLASEGFIRDRSDVGSIRVNLSPESAYWLIPTLGIDQVRHIQISEPPRAESSPAAAAEVQLSTTCLGSLLQCLFKSASACPASSR
jgi:formate dehydrogenase assembly factor FdhD